MEKQFNVFEEEIEECCSNPITGFFRDGFCHTDNLDQGLHVVCAYITDDFLEFSKSSDQIYFHYDIKFANMIMRNGKLFLIDIDSITWMNRKYFDDVEILYYA